MFMNNTEKQVQFTSKQVGQGTVCAALCWALLTATPHAPNKYNKVGSYMAFFVVSSAHWIPKCGKAEHKPSAIYLQHTAFATFTSLGM